MADAKISALPAAATPLAGTEVLPVVQGGVTDKVSVANLTVGRDVGVKKLNATDNVVIGTAGKGIDFSANTHAAGMTSELLNDYEEGTWTPTQGAGLTVSGTFTSEGTYTKIGRLVTVRGAVFATTISCTFAGIICGGLPYVSALDTAGTYFDGALSNGGVIDANGSNINAVGAIAGTTGIYFSVTYMV